MYDDANSDFSPEGDQIRSLADCMPVGETKDRFASFKGDFEDNYIVYKMVTIIRADDGNAAFKHSTEYMIVLDMDNKEDTTMAFSFDCGHPWAKRFPDQCGHRAFYEILVAVHDSL